MTKPNNMDLAIKELKAPYDAFKGIHEELRLKMERVNRILKESKIAKELREKQKSKVWFSLVQSCKLPKITKDETNL